MNFSFCMVNWRCMVLRYVRYLRRVVLFRNKMSSLLGILIKVLILFHEEFSLKWIFNDGIAAEFSCLRGTLSVIKKIYKTAARKSISLFIYTFWIDQHPHQNLNDPWKWTLVVRQESEKRLQPKRDVTWRDVMVFRLFALYGFPLCFMDIAT